MCAVCAQLKNEGSCKVHVLRGVRIHVRLTCGAVLKSMSRDPVGRAQYIFLFCVLVYLLQARICVYVRNAWADNGSTTAATISR